MQAVTEVLNKFRYGNSHLQMRQTPIPIAEDSGQCLMQLYQAATLIVPKLYQQWIGGVYMGPLALYTMNMLTKKSFGC